MKRLLAFALLLASTPATSAPVEVATGNWSELPLLQHRGYEHLSSRVMQKLYEISSEGTCQLPGRSGQELKFQISFAAQFSPDGTLNRVIIPKLGCPEAESVVGGAVLNMIREGDYRATGKNPDGWYRGNFGFGFTG